MLRRLDCVLAPTKAAALAEQADKLKAGLPFDAFVLRKTGLPFYKVSAMDLPTLVGDQDNRVICAGVQRLVSLSSMRRLRS